MSEKNYEWDKQESAGNNWKPEQIGEEIEGAVVTKVTGDHGIQYDISMKGGEIIVKTPSHKVLQDRMTKVAIGDVVKIVYQGEEAPTVKGHKPTNLYDVYIRREVNA